MRSRPIAASACPGASSSLTALGTRRYGPFVPSLKESLEACDADLRTRLLPGESVIAVGRCEDVTEGGDLDRGGAGWTFVMVTDRRLRWVPRSRLRYETEVDLDETTDAFEQTSAHRYAMTLDHAPVRALRDIPAHRFAMFRWGTPPRFEPSRGRCSPSAAGTRTRLERSENSSLVVGSSRRSFRAHRAARGRPRTT